MTESTKYKMHTRYYLDDGTEVPSNTTILNAVLGKPALVHWAWDLGTKGINYLNYRDDKGEIGKLTHHFILCDLREEEPDTDEYNKRQILTAKNCMKSYYEWKKRHKLEPILLETPLVSERYRYGGTPDYFGLVDGIPTVVDYKSGKGIFEDYYYQLCGYWKLLRENGYKAKQGLIMNFPRTEDEEYTEKLYTDFQKGWQIFYHCLCIYYLKKKGGRKKWQSKV